MGGESGDANNDEGTNSNLSAHGHEPTNNDVPPNSAPRYNDVLADLQERNDTYETRSRNLPALFALYKAVIVATVISPQNWK